MLVNCLYPLNCQMRGKANSILVVIRIVLALQTLGPDATLRTTGLGVGDPGPCPSGKPML